MSDTPIIRYPLSAITGIGKSDCQHGQQARACNVCELERKLAQANSRIVALEADADLHAHELSPTMVQARNDQLAKELAEARQINAMNARSIDNGRLENERLHKRIDMLNTELKAATKALLGELTGKYVEE